MGHTLVERMNEVNRAYVQRYDHDRWYGDGFGPSFKVSHQQYGNVTSISVVSVREPHLGAVRPQRGEA